MARIVVVVLLPMFDESEFDACLFYNPPYSCPNKIFVELASPISLFSKASLGSFVPQGSPVAYMSERTLLRPYYTSFLQYSNVGLGSSLRGEPGLTTFRSQGCP